MRWPRVNEVLCVKLTDLQFNTIDQLFDVIEYFGDPKDQIRYKNAVPYVHIPEELFNQWERFPRLAKERRDWFMDIFSAQQIESILDFNKAVEGYWKSRDYELLDVPEILDDESWLRLGHEAMSFKQKLIQNQPLLWQEYHKRSDSLE